MINSQEDKILGERFSWLENEEILFAKYQLNVSDYLFGCLGCSGYYFKVKIKTNQTTYKNQKAVEIIFMYPKLGYINFFEKMSL